MKASLTLNWNHLYAALCCASSDETRYILNGVLLEIDAEHVVAVGTDGRRLGIVRCDAEIDIDGLDEGKLLRVVVPLALIKKAKPAGKLKQMLVEIEGPTIDATAHQGSNVYRITMRGLSKLDVAFTANSIEGNYPGYAGVLRAIVKTEPTSWVWFNPSLLKGFSDAAKALGGGGCSITMQQTGEHSGIVIKFHGKAGCECFYGILMPCGDKETRPIPAADGWVFSAVARSEEAIKLQVEAKPQPQSAETAA